MTLKTRKLLIATFFGVLLTFVAVLALLVAWVATGPRSAEMLTPYIERAFTPPDGRYSVHIGETLLELGSWQQPIDIKLRNVRIDRHGESFASFSDIYVGIDLWSLPLGEVLPTSVTLNQPTLSLLQNEDRSISFGFGEIKAAPAVSDEEAPTTEAPPVAPVESFLALFSRDSESPLRKLRRLTVQGATATLLNVRHRIFLKVTDVDLAARRDRDALRITIGGNLRYGDHQSGIGVDIQLDRNQPGVDMYLMADRLVPGELAGLFAGQEWLKGVNVPLSGNAQIALDKDGALEIMGFELRGAEGKIESERLTGPIPVDELYAKGEVSKNGTAINLQELSLKMEEVSLTGEGKITLQEGDAAISGDFLATQFPAEKLKLYWPLGVSPLSREWVTENITEGFVPEARAHIDIKLGDLDAPILPKEAVDIAINVQDAAVRYLPGHPPITKMKSVVYIDGLSLRAEVESGQYMESTTLSNGTLSIPDLNADNPFIEVSLEANTTGKEAVTFLTLPKLEHAAKLGLAPESTSGAAQVKAKVGFYFFATNDDDIRYDVFADIKDFATPRLLEKFDIKNGTGLFTINNRGLTFKGTGDVNTAKVSDADISYLFSPDEGFDTFIKVSASAPVNALPRFGYPELPMAEGELGIKADVKQGPEKELSQATIDLGAAELHLPALGWDKPKSEKATLALTAEKKEGRVSINEFSLSGENVNASGSAMLLPDLSGVSEITLQKTKVGMLDVDHLIYGKTASALRIDVKGRSVDLSEWLKEEEGETPDFSFSKFPALDFKADIASLILSEEAAIRNFKGVMQCSATLCSSANITGKVGQDKPFNFRILKNPKGQRQLSLRAYDAGSFLNALGIVSTMQGGDLTVTGNYEGKMLNGRLIIDDYTITNAPILAKILSLTSLTAVLDVLRGNGISFTKMVAPFSLHNDVITITKAKAYGSSIGITGDGTFTFPERIIDIKGTVVPAYALNNVFSKLPLVGKLLTDDGQGMFAFYYSVRGTEKNPDVNVNPLSILTPGFLRGLFEGIDQPSPKEE